MDYVDLDDSKTNELLSSIRQNQNGAGWGMPRLMQNFDSFCSSVLTLVGSMALTISLFATPVPASEGRHALLNSPVFSIAVVGLMLACVCLSAAMATKSETYWARSLDSQNLLNRILSFFCFTWLSQGNCYRCKNLFPGSIMCEIYCQQNPQSLFFPRYIRPFESWAYRLVLGYILCRIGGNNRNCLCICMLKILGRRIWIGFCYAICDIPYQGIRGAHLPHDLSG